MKNWYAVHTHPQAEAGADRELRRQGFMTFFPVIRVRKRRRVPGTTIKQARFMAAWSDVPRFHRYIFVLCEPFEIGLINDTLWVSTVISVPGRDPVPLPDEIMDRIMEEAEGQAVDEVGRKRLDPGTIARIADGNPLEGLIAQVSVDLGNKIKAYCAGVKVELPPDAIGEIVSGPDR